MDSAQDESKPNNVTADDDYNSASDEDFNPEAPRPVDEEAESSDSENEGQNIDAARKRKQPPVAEDLDFDNSGDEATIAKAKRKKRKLDSNTSPDSDDEGGEGGLVKTRAQRRIEVQQKKPLMQTGKASIDVDALWAQLSKPTGPSVTVEAEQPDAHASSNSTPQIAPGESLPQKLETQPETSPSNGEPMITIKRSYEFAGQIMQEEKTVPASSAEAKLYLEEQAQKEATVVPSEKAKPGFRRPKKRASILDNPAVVGLDAKGPKLNTLQKSKLDWAAHVDKEGISEELDVHRRAKDGYLGRMDFLGRMEDKREDDLRNIRSK